MRGAVTAGSIGAPQHHASSWFGSFASKTSELTGRPATFLLAVAVVVIWAVTGPMFGYSDTWQLVINTGTTIVTFLMVFLIQNTQNRDTRALQIKLDELILATQNARDKFACIEDVSDEDLEAAHKEMHRRAARNEESPAQAA
jgi:low affinity Fe/Cu permease